MSEPEAIDLFRSAPWSKTLEVHGTPVRNLVQRQLRFGVSPKSGAGNGVELVPRTSAASRFLAGPKNKSSSAALEAYVALGRASGAEVNGVSLATSTRGMVLDHLVSLRDELPFTLQRDLSPDQVQTLQEVADGAYAFFSSNPMLSESPAEMIFGPWASKAFLDSGAGRGASSTLRKQQQSFLAARLLAHEMQHRISPVSSADLQAAGPAGNFFEEGAAEVAAELPGTLDAYAEALGMPHPVSAFRGPWVYPPHVRAIGELLRRADLDPSDQVDADRVRAILKGGPSTSLPDRLAREIFAAHPGTAATVDDVRRLLTAIGTDAGELSFDDSATWTKHFDEMLGRHLADLDVTLAAATP